MHARSSVVSMPSATTRMFISLQSEVIDCTSLRRTGDWWALRTSDMSSLTISGSSSGKAREARVARAEIVDRDAEAYVAAAPRRAPGRLSSPSSVARSVISSTTRCAMLPRAELLS